MTCRDTPRLADGYIDRDGPLAERLGLALHLAICSACRTYVRGLRVTRSLAASSLRVEIPERIAAAIEGQGQTARKEDQ